MTTAHVTVPKGVERIVLTLNNGEIEELRARLKDAEVCYRIILPGCTVMRDHPSPSSELERKSDSSAYAAPKSLRGTGGTPSAQ